MLLFLNELLNTDLRLGKVRIYLYQMLFVGYVISIWGRERIFMTKDLWFYIPLYLLASGWLNNPYKRFINGIRIYLNNKLFKRRFVVMENGIVTFSNNKRKSPKFIGLDNNIIGIICGNTIYLDKYYDYLKFNRVYNIIKYEGIGNFLMNNEFKDMDDLDKKLIVYRLGVKS